MLQEEDDGAQERRVSVEDLQIAPEVEEGTARVLCARCYSLSHYGCADYPVRVTWHASLREE